MTFDTDRIAPDVIHPESKPLKFMPSATNVVPDAILENLSFQNLNVHNNLINSKTCHLRTHHHNFLLTKFKLIINQFIILLTTIKISLFFTISNKTYIDIQSIPNKKLLKHGYHVTLTLRSSSLLYY